MYGKKCQILECKDNLSNSLGMVDTCIFFKFSLSNPFEHKHLVPIKYHKNY